MGAPELLHHLRGAGLVLTLTPAGGLHVAPRSALTDNFRAAIRAERDALVLALHAEAAAAPPAPRRLSGNPLMTPEQGDECHAGGWDSTEIDAYLAREARFTRLGWAADADHLAERLTLRDRQHDDRRLCLECVALAENRRCLVAARGHLPGAPRWLEPVSTILQRCEGFTLAPGLT
jgi:hypothetical protein